jgi:hypothetical protein
VLDFWAAGIFENCGFASKVEPIAFHLRTVQAGGAKNTSLLKGGLQYEAVIVD